MADDIEERREIRKFMLIAATLASGTTVHEERSLTSKEIYNRYVRIFERVIKDGYKPTLIPPEEKI